MFLQARVICIVGDNCGNAYAIDEMISNTGVKSKFFNTNPTVNKNRSYLNFLSKLPPETVFAVTKTNNNTNTSNRFKVAIPFVSSHLGLPIKEGETIWLQEVISSNDINAKFNITGYYLGRAHSYITTEDTTYCFDYREKDIFSADRQSYTDTLYQEKTDAKNKKDIKKKIFKDSNVVFSHNINFNTDETKFIRNSNDYFINNIRKYKLRSETKISKKPEDTLIRGSYNNMINLTSISGDNDENTKYGEINLIAGYGEYSKINPEEFPVKERDINNENIFSRKKPILKYSNEIAGSAVFNGVHFERLKSNRSFLNEGSFKGLNLDKFDNDSKNLKNKYNINSAGLTISEYNSISTNIQTTYPCNINDVIQDTWNNITPSKTLDANRFIIHDVTFAASKLPNISLMGGSEIVGIADSIVFSTHNSKWSHNNTIKLIQTNSDDNKYSQIALNDTGNILIDGNKILIGSHNRNDDVRVYICPSDISQSLVLGEQLKEFMHEMLTVQLDVYKILLNTLNKLNNSDSVLRKDIINLINDIKLWSSNGPGNLRSPPEVVPVGVYIGILQGILTKTAQKINAQQLDDTDKVTNYIKDNLTISNNNDSSYSSSSTKDIQYYKRLEEIISNLDDMLSKLAKTS